MAAAKYEMPDGTVLPWIRVVGTWLGCIVLVAYMSREGAAKRLGFRPEWGEALTVSAYHVNRMFKEHPWP